MKIQEELLKENSRRQADKIARYACQSKENFKELMHYYLSSNRLLAQRASWSGCVAAKMQPELISPYIKDLAKMLPRKDVHNALIRNTLGIFEAIEIPEKHQGKIMQECFNFLEDNSSLPAVKAYSITILFNLSKQHPDIRSELKAVIENIIGHETPAVKSRGKKVLTRLNKVLHSPIQR